MNIARLSRSAGLAVVVAAIPACVSPFDGLGQQAVNSAADQSQGQFLDDKIEDKHPTYDSNALVVEEFAAGNSTCSFTLNKSGSVTALEVKTWLPEESKATALFPSRSKALEALSGLSGGTVLPSMEVVNGALKPFNDGLYAAVELAMLEGAPGLSASTPAIIDALLARLAALQTTTEAQKSAVDSARRFLGAARVISGGAPDLPEPLLSNAQADAVTFQKNAELARPIGFYTWSESLQRAFTLVRFLQNRENAASFGAFAAMAVALKQDEALAGQYQSLLALYAGLTNPYVSYTPASLLEYVGDVTALDSLEALRGHFDRPLYACMGSEFAFVPTSRAKEADYFDSKYCMTDPPAGTNFLDEYVQAIRAGEVDLSLQEDSGWYDYQQWALETLLVPDKAPETDHLLLTAGYKKKLVDTFKAILISNRETHAAHVAMIGGGAAAEPVVVDLYPNFKVEPFPTFYLRTARAYRFLGTYLAAVLGEEFMQGQHSLRESGAVSGLSLKDELREKAKLLYGLYLSSAKAIGLGPDLLPEELAEFDPAGCEAAAAAWFQSWTTDADVMADPRVVVPAGRANGKMVLWAVIGVKALKISAEFVEGYEPHVASASSYCKAGKWIEKGYYLLTEESAEVQVRREDAAPPTRSEFRALCDRNQNREAIVAALEAL